MIVGKQATSPKQVRRIRRQPSRAERHPYLMALGSFAATVLVFTLIVLAVLALVKVIVS